MRKLTLILVCIIAVGSTVAKADEKLVDLVKKVKPSVVLISTFDKDNKPIAQGSGFFIDNKGRLITNHHVIEGAYSATIKTSTGKEYPVQGIVAKDTEADIVKLVVNLPDANVTFLNLSVNVPSEGEDIFVIGNPLGLESTVSSGIVSAVRDIPAFGKILQITVPISPGSSGSPVINSKGEVIGIATLIVTKGQNLNFAIPSDKIIALKETAKTALSESYASLTIDANVDTSQIASEIARELRAISKDDVIKEFAERIDNAPTKYTSDKNGFSVTFPSQPTLTKVTGDIQTTMNYQANSSDGLVSYNVFLNYLDKKLLSAESQKIFLDSHLAGRLLISENSRVITNNQLVFRGFNARNYEYIDVFEGVDILHKGIVFIVDGDSVSLTMVYPNTVVPDYSFDKFVASFNLIPLAPQLKEEPWEDKVLGLQATYGYGCL